MTRNRITRLAATFTSVIAVWLVAMPLTAQARPGTVGSSNQAERETPQITEFQVSPENTQAGSHSVINIWMRFCSPHYDLGSPPTGKDFGARRIIDASGTPIRITTLTDHTIGTGDTVTIQRVEGNTAANSFISVVTVPPDDPSTPLNEATRTFTINGSASNGTYVAGSGIASVSYAPKFGCNDVQILKNNLLKDFVLSLPPGLLGNPTAVTPCPSHLFIASACPQSSVVGNSLALGTTLTDMISVPVKVPPVIAPTPLYIVDTLGPEPARLGTALLPADPPGPLPILINLRSTGNATAGTAGDFGVDSIVDTLPTALGGLAAKLFSIDTNLCAAAPCDANTLAPLNPARPFAVTPTSCKPATSRMFARPYPPTEGVPPTPGPPSHAQTTFVPTDCDNVPFTPDVLVEPVSKAAGAPTSTKVTIKYPPYVDDPRWESALKDAEVILPDGMSLAAGGGVGLESCPEAAIGMGNDEPVNCPEGSRIGKVRVVSPALLNPLLGKAYLTVPAGSTGAPSEANPWKLFIVLEGQGVRVKIEGTVSLIPNDATGDPNDRLIKNVFRNNPETPFTTFELTTKGPDAADADNRGPAALANPNTCGIHTGAVKLYGYKNLRTEPPTDPNGTVVDTGEPLEIQPPLDINENCAKPFQPNVTDASAKPEDAAANSISHLRIERPDGHQNIQRLNFSLPAGALGSLATAPRCPAAQARVGDCSDESKVGIIRNTVGYGSSNLTVPGSLYIGEALQPGDAASFIIVVPAKVGPIDLGRVVVANRVELRRSDTGVDVLSGEIPTTLQGIPLPIQAIDITVNRENFFINPTGCDTRNFVATFFGDEGATATSSFAATALNCANVRFAPKLRLIAGKKGFTKVGAFAPLKAIVTQTDGEANIKTARVVIPSILRPNVPRFQKLANLCNGDQLAARACPPTSAIGNARVRSPVLPFELSGPVYAVLEAGAPLPKLAVFLRGGGFEIVIMATNGFQGIKILNIFPAVPDAAQSYFELNVNAGPTGALIVHDDLCKTKPLPVIEATFTGQNGKVVSSKPRLEADGCAAGVAARGSASIVSRRVKVSRRGVARLRVRCAPGARCAGTLVLRRGLGRKKFGIPARATRTVAVKLTRKGRRLLMRDARTRKRVSVGLQGSRSFTRRTVTFIPPGR